MEKRGKGRKDKLQANTEFNLRGDCWKTTALNKKVLPFFPPVLATINVPHA